MISHAKTKFEARVLRPCYDIARTFSFLFDRVHWVVFHVRSIHQLQSVFYCLLFQILEQVYIKSSRVYDRSVTCKLQPNRLCNKTGDDVSKSNHVRKATACLLAEGNRIFV